MQPSTYIFVLFFFLQYFLNLAARTLIKRELPRSIPEFLHRPCYAFGDVFLWLPETTENCNVLPLRIYYISRFFFFSINTPLLGISKKKKINQIKTASYSSIARGARQLCSLPIDVEDDDREKALRGQPYIPDFTKAFDHFCVHAGGRRVIDAIEVNLQLPQDKLNASRSTLYRLI